MKEKLYIQEFICNLVLLNTLSYKISMHNLYTNFVKILDICKLFSKDLVNEQGNIPRPGVVPRFSDLEIVSLSIVSEAMGIDSECLLFAKLKEYVKEMPNLISRRQYNDRRKPIEVCRLSRSKRCKMGKDEYRTAPAYGYCASQGAYYYGYKLHAVCGLSGVIHSFDLTKANVHDIRYLQDVKYEYHDCCIFGDRGYISATAQLDLFETANIRLEVPYRHNQKNWKPTFIPFAKARKRIETDFSQMCDQFMICRNYAKETVGLFTRIIGKISAFTAMQYLNHINNRPIGRVKYALA